MHFLFFLLQIIFRLRVNLWIPRLMLTIMLATDDNILLCADAAVTRTGGENVTLLIIFLGFAIILIWAEKLLVVMKTKKHLPLHLSLTSGLQEMCYFEVQKSGNAFMNIIEYVNM